ncbi:MAG: SDR family NAD(P)-dependent oxidoreductase [Ruminiclostridium sp.]
MVTTKKVAVVTGAAQGIGLAISKKLASQGICVAMVDINEEILSKAVKAICDEGYISKAFLCDVSSPESLQMLMDNVVAEFGQLDVLVNNAGILTSSKISEITGPEWDKVLSVNLKSVFFAIQKALPYLEKSKYPRIINMSSNAGRMGSYEQTMSYVASKGGIISLTYGMARRLAPLGITVNAICPGTIESPLFKLGTKEQLDNLLSKIPIGRFGQPDDVANGVAFLAQDESGFITGHCLDINGGMYFG